MSKPDLEASPSPHIARQRWMAVLARAAHAELQSLIETLPALPLHRRLRGPEPGMVMVRGRAGGGGGAFNLGEMSVTRCSVRDEAGRVGHAYVAGRDAAQAELAARLDALLQDEAWRPHIEAAVIAPLALRQTQAREANARKAAATRVQFFTLATMRTSS